MRVGTFNQEKALRDHQITNLRMDLFQAGGCLLSPAAGSCRQCAICMLNIAVSHAERGMGGIHSREGGWVHRRQRFISLSMYLCRCRVRYVKNWKQTISIIVCVCVALFIFCILMSYLSQVPSHGTATPGTAGVTRATCYTCYTPSTLRQHQNANQCPRDTWHLIPDTRHGRVTPDTWHGRVTRVSRC